MNPAHRMNPTLWRTCRMLSGSTRIQLIRLMHKKPGQNVATLARNLDISRPYASQELRRIQSRGLLKRRHEGSSLIYYFHADPQVPSAALLLRALRKTLNKWPPEHDEEISRIASGLGHERRIALATALLRAPMTSCDLLAEVPMSLCSYNLHLLTLKSSGFLIQIHRQFQFRSPRHPVGRALTKILQEDISRWPPFPLSSRLEMRHSL